MFGDYLNPDAVSDSHFRFQAFFILWLLFYIASGASFIVILVPDKLATSILHSHYLLCDFSFLGQFDYT